MRALKNVAAAHLSLADSYRDQARRHLDDTPRGVSASNPVGAVPGTEGRDPPGAPARAHSDQVAAAFFRLAFDEYREALGRDPTSAAALNRSARVFWEWRLAAADKIRPREPSLEPGLDLAREAEWNARRAVSMVEAKLGRASAWLVVADRSDKAQLQQHLQQLAAAVPRYLHPPAATALAGLGAVLLAQARPHEAIDVLASAQTLAPQHPVFDDVRWMLGHALLCAASRELRSDFPREQRLPGWRDKEDPRLEMISARRQKAATLFDRVREHERAREARLFTGRADGGRSLAVRREDWLRLASQREGGHMPFVLKEGRAGPAAPCAVGSA